MGCRDAAPLPYPTDVDMLVGKIVPDLLHTEAEILIDAATVTAAASSSSYPHRSDQGLPKVDAVEDKDIPMAEVIREVDEDEDEAAMDEQPWSSELVSCYTALCAALVEDPTRGTRLDIPVPSAARTAATLVCDRKLNKQQSGSGRDGAALLVQPDTAEWPLSTSFALRHSKSRCLHPAIAHLFAPIAARQSVGLESPREFVVRDFKRSLRLATADADARLTAGVAEEEEEETEEEDSGLQSVWALLEEVLDPPGAGFAPTSTEAQHFWELLLWAAIQCATTWFKEQQTGSAMASSRHQEVIQRVR